MRAPYTAALVVLVGAGLPRPLAAQDAPASPVIVAEVLEGEVEGTASLVGTVEPRRASLVAAETQGRVTARWRDPGDAVRRGDALVELVNDGLRASLSEALADVSLRRFRYQQSTQLLQQEAVSDEDLRAAEYELERARAKLQDLESQLEDLVVRAPFDGHVTEIRTEIGEWVTQGQAVARIIGTDTVWVYADAPETTVPGLAVGQRAEVIVDALGVEPRAGTVAAILAEASPESRAFPVAVELVNPDGVLRAGMTARVTLAVRRPGTSLLVHKDALVSDPQGSAVFLVVDGVAVRRAVRPGLARHGYVAVVGELAAGDLAVVRGNERLRDGQPVRIVRKQQ